MIDDDCGTCGGGGEDGREEGERGIGGLVRT